MRQIKHLTSRQEVPLTLRARTQNKKANQFRTSADKAKRTNAPAKSCTACLFTITQEVAPSQTETQRKISIKSKSQMQ